jgi:hypothetical protein
VVLAAVSVSPVFFRHLAAAPGHVRRLQAVQLSARRAAEHVRHLALARRAPEQEPRRLAASSQAAVLPVPGAVPSNEGHAHLCSLAEECRISGARLASPGRAEHCPRRHPASESGQACALAAGPVLQLAVKDGNSVALAALLQFLRRVSHLADFGRAAMATDVPAVPLA